MYVQYVCMYVAGTCLLSTDGGPFRDGDLWCVLAAVSSAVFILRLGEFSTRFDPAEINGTSFFTGTMYVCMMCMCVIVYVCTCMYVCMYARVYATKHECIYYCCYYYEYVCMYVCTYVSPVFYMEKEYVQYPSFVYVCMYCTYVYPLLMVLLENYSVHLVCSVGGWRHGIPSPDEPGGE